MLNYIKFSKADLEKILSCSILGDAYIYSLSSMVQAKSGIHQTLFINSTQHYITYDCQIGLAPAGLRVPMTPKQRVSVCQEHDEDQSKLITHLKHAYGNQFTEKRYGTLPEFTITIAKLFHVFKASGNKRRIPSIFTVVDKHTYRDALTNMYILHRRGHVFNIILPNWMSIAFQDGKLNIKTVAGNQVFQYDVATNDCTVELNPVANGENVLAELMIVVSNLIALNDLFLSREGFEVCPPVEEASGSDDFIESLHDIIRRQYDESRNALRLKLEHMLTSLKIMEVYHGYTKIDKVSETVNRVNGGDETEIRFVGSDIPSKILLKPAQVSSRELMVISRADALDFSPDRVLELLPSDNLMYPMLDTLIKEVKNCLNDYRRSCKKVSDMREYLPNDGDK